MKKLETALCLAATTLLTLAIPAEAGAEYLVPPSNSAATQYTEAIPSAGGPRDSDRQRARHADRLPAQVLGPQNAQRLREAGEPGREVAVIAAETAPPSLVRLQSERRAQAIKGDFARDDGGPAVVRKQLPSDAAGLGEVLGEATGSSSDGTGLLLPLLLASGLIWAIAYRVRQQKRMAG